MIIETGRPRARGTEKENNNKAVGQVWGLTLSAAVCFRERGPTFGDPARTRRSREFYLNVATERRNRGALWFALAERNNLIVSCFDRIIFVDSIA